MRVTRMKNKRRSRATIRASNLLSRLRIYWTSTNTSKLLSRLRKRLLHCHVWALHVALILKQAAAHTTFFSPHPQKMRKVCERSKLNTNDEAHDQVCDSNIKVFEVCGTR